MNESKIKSFLESFERKIITTYCKLDGKKTCIKTYSAVWKGVKRYCCYNNISFQHLIRSILIDKPKDMTNTEAIELVFLRIYYDQVEKEGYKYNGLQPHEGD